MPSMWIRTAPLAAPLVLLALAGRVLASDGVREINQTCALAPTGCFSGDGAGFPVEIDGSAGRSYRLTGDLVVPDEDTDGIVITTHDVGIDLNDFTIIGAACVGATNFLCRPTAGTGWGVRVDNSVRFGISVRNGSITGMGGNGVFLGSQGKVTDLRVRWNRLDGISAGTGSRVAGTTRSRDHMEGV